MSLITLTTDFGEGSYVAQMKGVILSLYPGADLIDVTHGVAPGDIREAAYLMETVVPAFPAETVHVVVVDPGVGTGRRILAIDYARRILLGPDNGALTAFLEGAREIRNVTEEKLFLPDVSATFHGRDIFAPVAAHLAGGGGLESVGPVLTDEAISLTDLHTHGTKGVVLHVDRFGNLVTSFDAGLLDEREMAIMKGPDGEIGDRARTFGESDPEYPFLYAGSGGRIEIALCQGSAADTLGWGRGTMLTFGDDEGAP